MASIQIENVQKAFGQTIAVDQLNLRIKDGEFFTFLGPSGCGKTTTLRMIAGFYYPTKGVVRFGDKDMTRIPPEQRNTGMVFQNYALFPHMTVFENAAFGLRVRKLPSSEVKKRVNDVLEKVRLAKYAGRQVSQLSGGQQQRVALARALVIEPEILLLDEPLSNLDAKLRDEMRVEILRLQRDYGITTIYVTHDQAEALSMSDRIAVFNNGVCHQVGTPSEIYNEPANDFVAGFIGEINLLPAEIEAVDEKQIHVKIPGGTVLDQISILNTPGHVEGKAAKGAGPFTVSIRPEAVHLHPEGKTGVHCFPGIISDVAFFGSTISLGVQVDGRRIQVNLLNNYRSGSLKEGEAVTVEFPSEHLRLIPAVSRGEYT